MGLQGHEVQHIIWNYVQLKNIVSSDSASGTNLKQKLGYVDELIYRELPEVLKKAAPPCVYELVADFNAAYENFKDFVIYQSLIGKNVVGLGGGFSSGKTSFLNSLMGAGEILPEGISPSAAVPTYLVHGSENVVKAINMFGACIKLEPETINKIGHGFSIVGDEAKQPADGASLGHVLKNLVLETNLQKYENLAFLDTPGYSGPESENYCARTDENTARQQLNTANFILWFLSVKEVGSLPDSDINFLKSLNPEIPITVICSKANQRTQAQRAEIKAKIEEQVMLENLNVDKVFFFDAETPKGLNSFGIYKMFADWNKLNCDEEAFARRFKRIFSECREYYKRKLDEADTEIGDLTNVLLFWENSKQTTVCIERVKANCQQEKALMTQQEKEMLRIQTEFFKEIKETAAEAGIYMPEDIDGLEDKIANSLQILRYYNKRHKNQVDPEIREEILDTFRGIQPVFECEPGGNKYRGVVFNILDEIAFPGPEEIRFSADINYSEFIGEEKRISEN